MGFMTVGYKNLHLYLWEAMKLLIMPPANLIRNQIADHKGIVAKVLKCRTDINAKRKIIQKEPSVRITEFTRERERLEEFKYKLKGNIEVEKSRHQSKLKELRSKYDKDGLQIIDDESQIGDMSKLSDEQKA